jgi:hypothetical protein
VLNVSSVPSPAGQAQVFFSGITWSVRSDFGGPGPNQFDSKNVWVDGDGFLHLRIAKDERGWTAGEVVSTQPFGFGTYEFQILGNPFEMDKHVTLALFNFAQARPAETNEMDIEFRAFGAPSQLETWTVWPAKYGLEPAENSFTPFSYDRTTQRFTWESDAVRFAAYDSWNCAGAPYQRWQYAPQRPLKQIPQEPMPVHLELALTGGAPTDGRPFEIVITRFAFEPQI